MPKAERKPPMVRLSLLLLGTQVAAVGTAAVAGLALMAAAQQSRAEERSDL